MAAPLEGRAGIDACLQICGFTRQTDRNLVIDLGIPNMRELLELKEEDAEELGKKYGLKDVLRCSAKLFGITNQMKGNVDQVFKSAVKHALIHRGLVNTTKKKYLCTLT